MLTAGSQNPSPTKKEAVFVLLSGGADSTTTLAIALTDFPSADVYAYSIDYGQRHSKEMEAAKAVCKYFEETLERPIRHQILEAKMLTGMLVDKGPNNEVIPNVSYAELPEGISPTYVSFRNGFMLSLMAAKAQSWIMDQEVYSWIPSATIYTGVHADDGVNWAYPDCTPEFIGAMANAIYVGTYSKVRLRAPLQYMSKADIIMTGSELGVPWELTWSCYKGEELHCGVCPTCRSRKEAFQIANIYDPTVYADQS